MTLLNLDMILGSVQMDEEFRPHPDGGLQGWSRLQRFDRYGRLVKVDEWRPTGARVTFGDAS